MMDWLDIERAKKSKHAENQWREVKRRMSLSVQCFPIHVTVSALLLNSTEDKVLLGYHPQFQAWSWIGGHLEPHESFMEGLRREVYEETHISEFVVLDDEIKSIRPLFVSPYHKRGKRQNPHIHLSLGYLGKTDTETVKRNEELEALTWHNVKTFMDITKEPWMNKIYEELLAQR